MYGFQCNCFVETPGVWSKDPPPATDTRNRDLPGPVSGLGKRRFVIFTPSRRTHDDPWSVVREGHSSKNAGVYSHRGTTFTHLTLRGTPVSTVLSSRYSGPPDCPHRHRHRYRPQKGSPGFRGTEGHTLRGRNRLSYAPSRMSHVWRHLHLGHSAAVSVTTVTMIL